VEVERRLSLVDKLEATVEANLKQADGLRQSIFKQAFSAKLRNDTDLDALSDDLVGMVRETMQPSHVSLWLRPETAQKGGQTD
jgi:hypothetical protein